MGWRRSKQESLKNKGFDNMAPSVDERLQLIQDQLALLGFPDYALPLRVIGRPVLFLVESEKVLNIVQRPCDSPPRAVGGTITGFELESGQSFGPLKLQVGGLEAYISRNWKDVFLCDRGTVCVYESFRDARPPVIALYLRRADKTKVPNLPQHREETGALPPTLMGTLIWA